MFTQLVCGDCRHQRRVSDRLRLVSPEVVSHPVSVGNRNVDLLQEQVCSAAETPLQPSEEILVTTFLNL